MTRCIVFDELEGARCFQKTHTHTHTRTRRHTHRFAKPGCVHYLSCWHYYTVLNDIHILIDEVALCLPFPVAEVSRKID